MDLGMLFDYSESYYLKLITLYKPGLTYLTPCTSNEQERITQGLCVLSFCDDISTYR